MSETIKVGEQNGADVNIVVPEETDNNFKSLLVTALKSFFTFFGGRGENSFEDDAINASELPLIPAEKIGLQKATRTDIINGENDNRYTTPHGLVESGVIRGEPVIYGFSVGLISFNQLRTEIEDRENTLDVRPSFSVGEVSGLGTQGMVADVSNAVTRVSGVNYLYIGIRRGSVIGRVAYTVSTAPETAYTALGANFELLTSSVRTSDNFATVGSALFLWQSSHYDIYRVYLGDGTIAPGTGISFNVQLKPNVASDVFPDYDNETVRGVLSQFLPLFGYENIRLIHDAGSHLLTISGIDTKLVESSYYFHRMGLLASIDNDNKKVVGLGAGVSDVNDYDVFVPFNPVATAGGESGQDQGFIDFSNVVNGEDIDVYIERATIDLLQYISSSDSFVKETPQTIVTGARLCLSVVPKSGQSNRGTHRIYLMGQTLTVSTGSYLISAIDYYSSARINISNYTTTINLPNNLTGKSLTSYENTDMFIGVALKLKSGLDHSSLIYFNYQNTNGHSIRVKLENQTNVNRLPAIPSFDDLVYLPPAPNVFQSLLSQASFDFFDIPMLYNVISGGSETANLTEASPREIILSNAFVPRFGVNGIRNNRRYALNFKAFVEIAYNSNNVSDGAQLEIIRNFIESSSWNDNYKADFYLISLNGRYRVSIGTLDIKKEIKNFSLPFLANIQELNNRSTTVNLYLVVSSVAGGELSGAMFFSQVAVANVNFTNGSLYNTSGDAITALAKGDIFYYDGNDYRVLANIFTSGGDSAQYYYRPLSTNIVSTNALSDLPTGTQDMHFFNSGTNKVLAFPYKTDQLNTDYYRFISSETDRVGDLIFIGVSGGNSNDITLRITSLTQATVGQQYYILMTCSYVSGSSSINIGASSVVMFLSPNRDGSLAELTTPLSLAMSFYPYNFRDQSAINIFQSRYFEILTTNANSNLIYMAETKQIINPTNGVDQESQPTVDGKLLIGDTNVTGKVIFNPNLSYDASEGTITARATNNPNKDLSDLSTAGAGRFIASGNLGTGQKRIYSLHDSEDGSVNSGSTFDIQLSDKDGNTYTLDVDSAVMIQVASIGNVRLYGGGGCKIQFNNANPNVPFTNASDLGAFFSTNGERITSSFPSGYASVELTGLITSNGAVTHLRFIYRGHSSSASQFSIKGIVIANL